MDLFGRKKKKEIRNNKREVLLRKVGLTFSRCSKENCHFYEDINTEVMIHDFLVMNHFSFVCITCKEFNRNLDHYTEDGELDDKTN